MTPAHHPLTADDERLVRADLTDIVLFEALLPQKGIDGLAIACEECNPDRHLTWSEVTDNLITLLRDGTSTANHDQTAGTFATWDWCRGYAASFSSDIPRYLS